MSENDQNDSPPADNKPAGWDRVDTTQIADPALRQAVDARLGRYHKQTKELQRVAHQQAKDMKGLMERYESLEGRVNGTELENVRSGLQAAIEAGDSKSAGALTERLARLTSDMGKKGKETEPPALTPKTKGKASAPEQDPDDLPSDPLEGVSLDDEAALTAWASERGQDGQLLRPWTRENHPQHRRASKIMEALTEDPDLRAKGAKAILAEADRAMGLRVQRGPGAAVLGSDGDPPRGGNTRMTADQKEAARLMGVSDERYMKAFAAQPRTADGRTLGKFIVEEPARNSRGQFVKQ